MIKFLAAAVLLLFLTGTASAQTLVANPAQLLFQSGEVFKTVSVSVSNNSTVSFTAAANSAGNWLDVSPKNANAPFSSLIVSVNTAGLAPNTTYTGSVMLTASGLSPLSIPVTVLTGGATNSSFTTNQASLSFTSVSGSTPAVQQFQLGSNVGTLGFTASVQFNAGTNWLTVNPLSGNAPAAISVAANPAGLNPGTYSATITFTPTSGTGGALQIPVTFLVSGTPQLAASSTSASFYYQVGTSAAFPQQQTVNLTSGGTPLAFTATATTNTGINWLVVSPISGSTPADLTIAVNSGVLGLLTPNVPHTGTVTVNSAGGNATIQVSLTVSTNPLLVPNPSALSFDFQPGTALPATKNVAVTSTGTALPFVVSTPTPWLSVSPFSGTTPGTTVTVGLSAAAQNMTSGTYSGIVTLTPISTGGVAVNIPVTLNVSNTPALMPSTTSLTFNYQINRSAPAPQAINIVSSSGAPVSFTVQASSTGNWLSLSAAAGTTPGTLGVFVSPAGLAKQATPYQGTITLTPVGSSGPTQTIQVNLNVSDNPLMNISPPSVTFTVPVGGTSTIQTSAVALTSTGTAAGDPTLNFTATTATTSGGTNWLAVSPTSGAIPNNLNVILIPANLGAGTYNGSVTVTATDANGQTVNSQIIPVTATVSAGTISVDTNNVTFTQAQGGTAPASKTVKITSDPKNANFSFTATPTVSIGGNWLKVSPTSGTTPADLTISVDGTGFSPGTYTGTVSIAAQGASNTPQVINVTLTVGQAQTIALSTTTVPFAYQIGTSAPAAQKVGLTSTGGNLAFTAAAAVNTPSGGNWLKVEPATGNTPADLSISVNPAGLAAGNYAGTVTVAAPNASNSPQVINVSLAVSPAALPKPALTHILSAASYAPGGVTPGEIIYMEGTNLGPATLSKIRLNAAGMVETKLADTRVLFDGIPAPLVYVSATQTSAVVPFAIAGRVTTRIQIELNGVTSDPMELTVRDSRPAIFTVNQAGTGPGAILNQDFSLNSAGNGAAKGSTVMVYATGGGVIRPTLQDGAVGPSVAPFPEVALPVTATVGGRPAQVTYKGTAPTLTTGLLQVNVVIPADAPSGNQPLVLTIGGNNSQPGVTVAVQ